ncbi:hypothetical protein ANCDUO_24608 [Ancylostoma duodenale]|uniref:Uncharacterized protein n=1 Tax=Ancylostoma duodenale TaxID=51022 RepID=A0A0C2FKJ7_9BILA|nr:hypothetical protein ANCDUO_24608 [Ancylostoma duodenale]
MILQLFYLILELEGQSVWVYGEASCSSYPLTKIDTINEVTGEMNEESALSLVVYGQITGGLIQSDGSLANTTTGQFQWTSTGETLASIPEVS